MTSQSRFGSLTKLATYCVLSPLLGPIYLVARHSSRRSKKRKETQVGYRRSDQAPTSRLKSRRRALTSSSRPPALEQPQCNFLSKLPYEVRQLIWEMCLGGMKFHLKTRYVSKEKRKKLSYTICGSRADDPYVCENAVRKWSAGVYSEGMLPAQLLSPLLTCH
jgi:hypothetical protein